MFPGHFSPNAGGIPDENAWENTKICISAKLPGIPAEIWRWRNFGKLPEITESSSSSSTTVGSMPVGV